MSQDDVVPCRIAACPFRQGGQSCYHYADLRRDQICGLCSAHDTYGTQWIDDEILGVPVCLWCARDRRHTEARVRQLYHDTLHERVGDAPAARILFLAHLPDIREKQ